MRNLWKVLYPAFALWRVINVDKDSLSLFPLWLHTNLAKVAKWRVSHEHLMVATDLYNRYILRFFDCLAHPNLSATFATDQKWPIRHLCISFQSLSGSLRILKKSEFLKLLISFFHYFWCQNQDQWHKICVYFTFNSKINKFERKKLEKNEKFQKT